MLRDEYLFVVQEYFDVTDNTTRRCLLSINEADQNQVMASLANKLYNIICKKATDIDFGLIPNSKGDINNIPNFIDIWNSLQTVRDLIISSKQSTSQIDSIIECIENLQKSRYIWEKAFNINNDLACMYYNTMALSIVSATSIYISSAIEFIKNPGSDGVDMELSRVTKNKSKDGLLFTNIAKFNKAYRKGEIDKTMGGLLKVQKDLHESGMVVNESVTLLGLLTAAFAAAPAVTAAVGSIMFIGALVTLIIPMMHQLTTFYYHMRVKLSEYLELESQIIRLNAEKLKYDRSKTEEEKKKIADKQRKIADKFSSAAQKIAIKSTKAEKVAVSECKQDEKYKIDDVTDNMPDSAVIW